MFSFCFLAEESVITSAGTFDNTSSQGTYISPAIDTWVSSGWYSIHWLLVILSQSNILNIVMLIMVIYFHCVCFLFHASSVASAESIRKNALLCDNMHFIDERSVTLKSFDVTLDEDKVRTRVSLCIRSSDTVSICSVCMLKPE